MAGNSSRPAKILCITRFMHYAATHFQHVDCVKTSPTNPRTKPIYTLLYYGPLRNQSRDRPRPMTSPRSRLLRHMTSLWRASTSSPKEAGPLYLHGPCAWSVRRVPFVYIVCNQRPKTLREFLLGFPLTALFVTPASKFPFHGQVNPDRPLV